MAFATFDGVEIPAVFEMDMEDEILGDFGRTAGGKERGDVIGVKRTVILRTRPITQAERDALVVYLRSILYRYGTFSMDGEDAFAARITLQQRRNYVLPDRWELTLTVTEQ